MGQDQRAPEALAGCAFEVSRPERGGVVGLAHEALGGPEMGGTKRLLLFLLDDGAVATTWSSSPRNLFAGPGLDLASGPDNRVTGRLGAGNLDLRGFLWGRGRYLWFSGVPKCSVLLPSLDVAQSCSPWFLYLRVILQLPPPSSGDLPGSTALLGVECLHRAPSFDIWRNRGPKRESDWLHPSLQHHPSPFPLSSPSQLCLSLFQLEELSICGINSDLLWLWLL